MPWKRSQRGSGRAGLTTVSATSQTFPAGTFPDGVRGAFALEFHCLERQDRYSPKGLLDWESHPPGSSPAAPGTTGPGASRAGQFLDRWSVFGFCRSLVLIRQVFPVVLTQPDEPAADLPMEGVTKLSIPDLGQWSRDQGGVPASTG